MRMPRLLILACIISLALGLAVRAQPPTPAPPQITAAEAQQALSVLQDPQKRAQFIAVLETLARAAPSEPPGAKPAAPPPAPPPAPAPAKPEITVAPHSLGAEVVFGASRFLNQVTTEAVSTLSAIRSVPLLWNWLRMMATDPWAHGVLMDIGWRLALALVAGFAVQWAIRRSVARPILALAGKAPNGNQMQAESGEARVELGETEPPRRRITAALVLLRRLPLVGARLFLELLPVLGFVTVGHLIAATSLGGNSVPRLVILAVVDATALCGALLATARMMLSPGQAHLRLLTLSDAAAAYLMRWTRRIVIVSVYGYAIAEVGLLLGLTYAAHDGLLKAVGLLDHVFLGIIVIQRRRTVRKWLRAPEGATGMVAAIRNWFARVWHWIALLLLATLWLAWVVEVPHGYQLMFRYALSLVVVAAVARVLQIALLGALDRALTPQPDTATALPRPRCEARDLPPRSGRHRPRLRVPPGCAHRAAVLGPGHV